jgi:hypothetical protein
LNAEVSQSFISWNKAVAVVSFATLWAICVAFCVMLTDFIFNVSPPPLLKLPFEFHVFTSWLDAFSSNHLPIIFTWGHYHIEAYFGRHPHPRPMSSAIVDYASLSASGRTIKALTSVTYSPTQHKLYRIFLKVGEGHSPVVTLMEGLELGQCWAFYRDAGQLGI